MKRGILKVLMEELSNVTLPECQNSCNPPMVCCKALYCRIAFHYARRNYGIVLQPTGHPELLFMSDHGCVVAPHLRPMCTLHVCAVVETGQKANDNDWNRIYWQLRNRVEDLIMEVEDDKKFLSLEQ